MEAGCVVLHVVSKVFLANISLDLREELTQNVEKGPFLRHLLFPLNPGLSHMKRRSWQEMNDSAQPIPCPREKPKDGAC